MYTFDTYINKGSVDVVQSLCLEYHPPLVSYVGAMMERMKRYKLLLVNVATFQGSAPAFLMHTLAGNEAMVKALE